MFFENGVRRSKVKEITQRQVEGWTWKSYRFLFEVRWHRIGTRQSLPDIQIINKKQTVALVQLNVHGSAGIQ